MTTTPAPAKTSSTKWLAVATTENAMAIGISTANARSATLRLTRNSSIPSSRFQPAWKLGIAAYSLMNDGGSAFRYPSACSVTVSSRPTGASRGGATGKSAKITSPNPPDSRITVRSRRYSSGPRW